MPLPREYLSYNQIRIYIECPKKYSFLYIDEKTPPLNDRVLVGLSFHAAVEFFFRRRINGDEASLIELEEEFFRHFISLQENRVLEWKIPRTQVESRGKAFIRCFHDEIAPGMKPLICEREFSAVLPGSGIMLKGIIDLVEEDFTIIDFKTSGRKWSQNKAQRSLQMVIYKYLLEQVYGPVFHRIRYEILFGKTSSNVRRQSIIMTPGDEEEKRMIEIVTHIADLIQRGVFTANINYQCKWCDFKKNCINATL